MNRTILILVAILSLSACATTQLYKDPYIEEMKRNCLNQGGSWVQTEKRGIVNPSTISMIAECKPKEKEQSNPSFSDLGPDPKAKKKVEKKPFKVPIVKIKRGKKGSKKEGEWPTFPDLPE